MLFRRIIARELELVDSLLNAFFHAVYSSEEEQARLQLLFFGSCDEILSCPEDIVH